MGIELYRTCPPLFRDFFRDPAGRPLAPAQIEVAEITRTKAGHVGDACAILGTHARDDFSTIRGTMRGILVYSAPHPHSFAPLGAHGVVFINARRDSSPVSFVEDILRQCGHVVFNAATVDRGEVLAANPDAPLHAVTDLDDHHSVYEAFHDLFTQTSIHTCLQRWSDSASLTGSHLHELHGRISHDMKRFAAALRALARRDFYTELGWDMFCHFRDTCAALYQDHRALIERFDTSNQPDVFDYQKFVERNPLPQRARAEHRQVQAVPGRGLGDLWQRFAPGVPAFA